MTGFPMTASMTGFPMTDAGISEVAHLRLVNGSSRCAGRVEVLYNQVWGTVCDHDWDITDAGVVCRQLGCGAALSAPGGARFGKGSDPIWLDDVTCTGTEVALSSCGARPWGMNNCNHGEDAGVVCSDSGISEVAQLRLVNGSSRCAGRVEVLYNQVWGTVCDDDWDITDAGVVCRQLDCGTALSAPGGARFGQGSDLIWLDDVNCAGTENALSDCGARPWGTNNCNHGEDAGVVCSGAAKEKFGKGVLQVKEEQTQHPWASMTGFPMTDSGISEVAQLRLVNGPSPCAGRVEVLYNQVWGTVCDDSWDLQDAGVVCRQLDCGTALSAPGGARFGRGSDRIWLDDVNCAGTENALSDCGAWPWGTNNCYHGEDAGVVCSGAANEEFLKGVLQVMEEQTEHPWASMTGFPMTDSGISEVAQLRLVNGPSPCAGRVEVLYNQVWGTVCDDSWDLQDAGVVCRQLDCGTVLSAPGGARFGQGSDRIWLDDVNCAGTENALSDCGARPWGTNNCYHGEDAGVVCSGAANEEFLKGVLQVTEEQTQHPWASMTGFPMTASMTGFPMTDSGISEVAQLRLVNGSSRCAGRVEVLYNQVWGTVCDDDWDITDAGVVCRQLDCGTALSAPGGARFGQGSDLIWLDEVNCAGTENALSDCGARPWGTNNCYHGEDAGVVCSGAANEEFLKGVLQVKEEQTQHPWETVGSINPAALRETVDHVDKDGLAVEYAFAVSLQKASCENPSGLEQVLRRNKLRDMQAAINPEGVLYDPDEGPIVAARMQRLGRAGEHAEWRLLQGDRNSPVQKLLARTYNERSCLIFFTIRSPCAGTCLLVKRPHNILRMVSDTFRPIDHNYKAFVFWQIYRQDRDLDSQSLLEAWHQLPNVPLLRCDTNGCRDCRGNDPSPDPSACLDEIRAMRPLAESPRWERGRAAFARHPARYG
ncbi:scavenger receptor cysteine-rich domain-containing group B protein-like [Mauremys mutica]|uniref:scavenger receptor cysteine-rich domain-containing group B protein-like n=1 Tax=Mauremys mutica TaxID=74926 RepID=UPI001D16DEF1|nr:scavenger receptor cysteine-rich domain-containing group B protein-like [Mauremys mutica]